jgi:tetratricopeptide (TPR) repeat protein
VPQRDDQGPKPPLPTSSGEDFPSDDGDLFDAIIVEDRPRPVQVPAVHVQVPAPAALALPPQPTSPDPDLDIDTDDIGAAPAPAPAPAAPASAFAQRPRFTPAGSTATPAPTAPATSTTPGLGPKPAAKPTLSAASLLHRGGGDEGGGGGGLPTAMPARNPPPAAQKTIELDGEILGVRGPPPQRPPPPPGDGRVAEAQGRAPTAPSPSAPAHPASPAQPSVPNMASAAHAATMHGEPARPVSAPASDSGARLSFGEPSPRPTAGTFTPPGGERPAASPASPASPAIGDMRTRLVGRVPPGQVRPAVPVPGDRAAGTGPSGQGADGGGPRVRATPAMGVPTSGPQRPGASGPVTRSMSNPMLTAENPFMRYAQTQIGTWEAELATQPDLFRAARLNYEIARLYEYPLGDLNQAATYYLRAHGLLPEYLPILRGARRVLLAQRNFQRALPLFDAEIRLTADPRRKAALCTRRAACSATPCATRPTRGRLRGRARARSGQRVGAQGARADRRPRSAPGTSSRRTTRRSPARSRRTRATARRWSPGGRTCSSCATRTSGRRSSCSRRRSTSTSTAPGAFAALKRLHHGQGRWRELIGVLEREAGQISDPDLKAMAFYRIARMHSERLGNRDKAILALERSVAENPKYRLVVEELIRQYGAAERHDAQVKMLELLVANIEAPPERISILYQIGELHEQRLYNEDEAIRWYEAALEIEPTFRPSLRALSKLYTPAQDVGAADPHAARNEAEAADDSSRAAAAHARMAEIFEVQLERRRTRRSTTTPARSRCSPGLPTPFKALTRLYGDAGRYHELIELLERGIDEAGDEDRRVAYLFRIADIYADYLHEPVQAAHTFRRILKIDPDHLGAIHALQRVLRGRGALQGAGRRARDRGQRRPSRSSASSSLLFRAADILDDKLEDREGALSRYRRALELDPKYAPALAGLGRLYHRLGRWDDLLAIYERELGSRRRGGPRSRCCTRWARWRRRSSATT